MIIELATQSEFEDVAREYALSLDFDNAANSKVIYSMTHSAELQAKHATQKKDRSIVENQPSTEEITNYLDIEVGCEEGLYDEVQYL